VSAICPGRPMPQEAQLGSETPSSPSRGLLTCEGTPNQGIGCQGARCVPRVCVNLDRPPRARISIHPPSVPIIHTMLLHRIMSREPRPCLCFAGGVGYTHQKSKDSCKSERHPAKQTHG
jgi:hypothetical protein